MNRAAPAKPGPVCGETPDGAPAPASPRPVLLLGLGNDILSDDAIGLEVARALRGEFAHDPRIEVRETSEMGLALLDFLTARRAALLVDAIQTGTVPPGTLLEPDPADWEARGGCNPHLLGVAATLALGRRCGLPMPERVKILAIEAADPFTLGTALTPALRAALPAAVGRARRLLVELAGSF
jgi:hydrogenase maturation protease